MENAINCSKLEVVVNKIFEGGAAMDSIDDLMNEVFCKKQPDDCQRHINCFECERIWKNGFNAALKNSGANILQPTTAPAVKPEAGQPA